MSINTFFSLKRGLLSFYNHSQNNLRLVHGIKKCRNWRILKGKTTPSNKTLTVTKSIIMDTWVVGTLNKLFVRYCQSENEFSKKESCQWQNSVFCARSICTFHSICHNIGFWQGSFVWKYCVFNHSTFNWKTVPSFLKVVFIFQKMCFNVKVLKAFKYFHWFLNENMPVYFENP